MPSLTLKTYQAQALQSLQRFATDALGSAGGLHAAWAREMLRQSAAPGEGQAEAGAVAGVPYRSQPFGDTPCVCLRIPTGGGKTLLAAHAIALLARCWRQADAPVALWLVPSTTIRDQTLKALQQPGHAYRAALEVHYGQALTVLDLEAAPTLAVQDLGQRAVVLVATMQSFRVRQTQGRNVYAHSEEFDTHFAHLRAQGVLAGAGAAHFERLSEAEVQASGGVLNAADVGQVKYSLANLLAATRPIVVVDEAHNAKTDTTFETLKRIAPSIVLELTATPVPGKTNVLYSVGARELQAEDMIRLPVLLAEHRDWTAAVHDAVLRRRQLEAESAQEAQYLRPIVLFQAQAQAQDKPEAVTPARLRQHLLREGLASADEIVIATGEQRGLDGLNLFDLACPVRHVITIEALKEGWDCSFAYVLCSLQNVRSGKDVEQLLGRVLRMPYAQRRRSPLLNRAYAHVVARSFSEAATALADRMVQGMGFDALDKGALLLPVGADEGLLADPGSTAPVLATPVVLELALPEQAARALADEPDLHIRWPVSSVAAATHATGGADTAADEGPVARLVGAVSEGQVARVLAALPPASHAEVLALVQAHNQRVAALKCPALRGVPFAPIPRLCLRLHGPGAGGAGEQGELHLFERNTLDEVVGFDLLRADPRPELPAFHLAEQSDLFEIGIGGSRVHLRQAKEPGQLSLDAVPTQATETDLVLWLVQALRQHTWTEAALRRWATSLVSHLVSVRGMPLTGLLRARQVLAHYAQRRLETFQEQARLRGFKQLLLPDTALPAAATSQWHLGTSDTWAFRFEPGRYAPRHVYAGRWQFGKHYFELIHGLKSQGEEFECAVALDRMPQVRHWVRNIERQESFSFWLPTATDYFYPDFVAELLDGRLLVVEYKGEAYATNDDSREKCAIGAAWARASAGRAVFVMVEKQLNGMDMADQLRRAMEAGR